MQDLRILLLIIGIVGACFVFYKIVRSLHKRRQKREEKVVEKAEESTEERHEDFEEVILKSKQADPLLEPLLESEHENEHKDAFVALSLIPKERAFPGHLLLSVLRGNHFHLNQHKVFCRHVNEEVTQPILFSVLSIREPGTFEFSQMPQDSFSGILILMMLPGVGEPTETFEKMLMVAKQLATALNAEVCNSQRHPLTLETLIDYRNRILKWA